jgi:L-idonate 5-dehydrogenase
MLAARLEGLSEVVVIDVAQAPLTFARGLGADHTVNIGDGDEDLKRLASERLFDVAFEASGTAAGLNAAILNVRRGGTVVQIGNLPGGLLSIAANAVMAREIDLKGSFRFGDEFETAVDIIAEKKIDVLSIVTAERPLAAAPEAIRLALDKTQSVKVVLTGA